MIHFIRPTAPPNLPAAPSPDQQQRQRQPRSRSWCRKEAAHVLLHDPKSDEFGALLPRGHKEVEAESVVFVVARAHGMPTDEYSFPYVAAWAGDESDQIIGKTAQRVANCARQLITISPAEHLHGGRPAPSRELDPPPCGSAELAPAVARVQLW